MRRAAALALLLTAAAAAPAPAALGPVGSVEPLPGADGCRGVGAAPPCAPARAVSGIGRGALTPDGGALLLPAVGSDSVAVLLAGPSGALAQSSTAAGCVAPPGNALSCRPAPNLDGAAAVAVSPDGRHAYVAGANGIAVLAFSPDPDVGGLVPLPGASACLSSTGAAQPGNEADRCTDGRGLSGLTGIAVSPDGRSVYATVDDAGDVRDGVVALQRDAGTGALVQGAGAAGCLTTTGTAGGDQPPLSGCGVLRAADGPSDVAVSATGDTVLLAARRGVVAVRRAADGRLRQPDAATSCVVSVAEPGCTDGRALNEPWSLALGPDGDVHVAGSGTREVATLQLGPDGALTQDAGRAGCTTDDGSASDGPGPCAAARALAGSGAGIGVAPDGRTVAVGGSPSEGEVALLDRAPGGALSQAPDRRGCVSRSGAATGTGGGEGRCTVAPGTGGTTLHWRADGAVFYAAGEQGVAVLRREVAPACAPASGAGRAGTPIALDFACTDANGDAVTLEVLTPPALGGVTTEGTRATYAAPATASGPDRFAVRPVDASGNGGAPVDGSVEVAPAPAVAGPVPGASGGTAPPLARAPLARLVGTTLRPDRRRRVRLVLACPAAATTACRGTLVLRTSGRVRPTSRSRARRVVVLTVRFVLAPGARRTFRPRATVAAVRALRRVRRLRLTTTTTAPARPGLTAARTTGRATLRR